MKAILEIEKPTAADNNIRGLFNSLYPTFCCKGYNFTASQKEAAIRYFQHYLPSFKVGAGGSHLWISNQSNERLAIIYFK